MSGQTITVDSMKVKLNGEKNLLEVIRNAGIELPTFCYHSEISVYGACRMCMVEVEGRGILPACSTGAEEGMVVHTNTKQIRNMRKIIIELMLASHEETCTTCRQSSVCRLQDIAKQLGVKEVRYKKMVRSEAVDLSSPSIAYDPSKCILCGDCVRVCNEIQAVSSLDFAYRGASARVVTPHNKGIGLVECVGCGQCVKICPVGALTIKTNLTNVWEEIYNEDKFVIAQIAPSVRVAIGECFGEKPGVNNIGKIVSALRMIGFDRVYDMNYGADFTVVEEGKELLSRLEKGEHLPILTSCCPAWVKFVEQLYPDLLSNLSTAKSPMHMFGALSKEILSKELNIPREKIVDVCVAPCTAKKYEAERKKFKVDGIPDVDHVITTEELARMIKEHGIEFDKLEPSSLDMPLSFATGGAAIFGVTGGVCEAVLRYAADALEKGSAREFKEVRGSDGIRVGEVAVGSKTLKLCVVSGLSNAKTLIEKVMRGEEYYDVIEVMACPGGCINGGGQPVDFGKDVLAERARGLYDNDRSLQFHVSSENPFLQHFFNECDDKEKEHEMLHTTYENRRLLKRDDFALNAASEEKLLSLTICFGRSCFHRGAQALYMNLMKYIRGAGLDKYIEFNARFCSKMCERGPVLQMDGETLEFCTYQKAVDAIEAALVRKR
ncbi:MAG: [FeFe] hydrogenase, group A [Oscillospiraceae bacterium]|nr:[FeFe] hydrogenase, group A [Oscillospiraceae bacterium]